MPYQQCPEESELSLPFEADLAFSRRLRACPDAPAEADRIELHLATDDERVWVAVRDEGPGFSPTARDLGGAGGFGFVIVAARSDEWGIDCGGDGCTVWCAIARPGEL